MFVTGRQLENSSETRPALYLQAGLLMENLFDFLCLIMTQLLWRLVESPPELKLALVPLEIRGNLWLSNRIKQSANLL